jgi:sigma-B regulation protein RsbU (phosphoserine phosphatase)
VQRGRLGRAVTRDLRALYTFYLDDGERARLGAMGRLRRWPHSLLWTLRTLLRSLAPARRVLLLAAFVAMAAIPAYGLPAGLFGAASLIAVLMGELRDKVIARNELEVGRAVQRALVPSRAPDLDGWDIWLHSRPAHHVGGDLVDWLRVDGQRLALTLADVAGKGLGAALLMAKLQATLRAWSTEDASLPEIGGRTNRILCRDGLPGRFATLVQLELRANDGGVALLNAGHIPPLVVRADAVERLPPVALPIGLLPAATYEAQQVHLHQDDMLVLYSDGLSESTNAAGDMFGDDRVQALAATLDRTSAARAGAQLLDVLATFAGDTAPSDDLSLAVIRRRRAPRD